MANLRILLIELQHTKMNPLGSSFFSMRNLRFKLY